MKYLCSLGSNIDPEMNIHHAKQQLRALNSNCLFSQNIATKPVDIDTQNGFLNALFIIDTSLSSHELKQRFNQIEEALGRDRSDPERSIKDRTIDIDILGPLDEGPEVPDYLQSLTTELGLAS
jgi:2-amino-4-hydroxy-6-hydroxymethyldihydropteridine diphosphokinase